VHSARSILFFPILLSLLFFAAFPSSISTHAAEKRYIVKKNDTLSEIARKHGVSASALMRHNGLKEANQIHVGKVLRIPGPELAARKPLLDRSLSKELDATRIIPHKWKHIVIHHSATESGTVKGMDRYHRGVGMENGLAYHFVIGNGKGMPDGEITIGQRWIKQIKGGHLKSESLNEQSIGICLVGNFDQEPPTRKQMDHLAALVDYLTRNCRLGISAVKTHQQIHPFHTRCPGRKFPMKAFLKGL
jgi:LysM repeat protein